MNSVFSRLIASSWSASTIQVGTAMRWRSTAVQLGWVSHILVIWARKALYSVGVGGRGKQLRHALGMRYRDVEADDRAIAPADDRGLLDLQEIHQRDDIPRHQ